MEKFKRKIRKRIFGMSLTIICLSITYFVLLSNKNNLPKTADFIMGFQTGVFCGLELGLVFYLVKNMVSIRDENSLKKLYIKENDERTIMIMQKTGAMGMAICNIGLGFATVIAGFFNQIVFFSLLGATAFTALVKGFFKLYYHNKL